MPLYLLVGVSWLLAPALAHEHYGILRLISDEEAARHSAGVWFRVCDVVAAVLLLVAVLSFRVGRHARWFGKTVVVVTVLSAIDGLFPDTCYVGHTSCGLMAAGVSTVHDIETLLLGALIAGLSIFDAVRHRRAASIGFVVLQLAAAFMVVSGLASPQFRILLQYAYETALIIWLGWLVDRYNPVAPAVGHEWPARRILGLWVVLGGIFALVTAIPHVRLLAAPGGYSRAPYGLLLEQHGVITGVLMLYLARHLLRGERPALWLATLLFYSQIVKYAVLTPQPVVLAVYVVLLALLVYSRRDFDRNTQPPTWLSRLGDVGVVVGGSVVALLVLIGAVSLTGHRARFFHVVQSAYNKPLHALDTRADSLSEHREARLRTLAETLGVSLGAVSLWSLFRPRPFTGARLENHCSRAEFERLLHHYATSSEDFFKLWPGGKDYYRPTGSVGAIAYRVEGGIAFMLADPVAPSEREREQVLKSFAGFCRRHGWVLCALLVGGKPAAPYEQLGLTLRQIGSSAVIDVARFNGETARGKWWRWQRNRAARAGWHYEKLLPPHSGATMAALRAVSDAWLHEGGRTEQGFALGYFDETYLQRCKIHVLKDEAGAVVAFANELPVFGKVRCSSVDLIRYLPETSGAMPALLQHVIAGLEGTKFTSFDLGFVPLARLEGDLAKLLRRVGKNRFSAAGLEQFKNKFDPTWHPDYIAYDGDLIDLAKIAGNLERLVRIETKNEVQ